MINTYIINASHASKRREHMESVLSTRQFLNANFANAILGKNFSYDEIEAFFDRCFFIKRYGREANPGQIGCTLSHRLCYKMAMEQSDNFVLILEDDASLTAEANELLMSIYEDIKNIKDPMIVLLSPNFTYTSSKKKNGYEFCHFYSGSMTIGYYINRSAAKLILETISTPGYLADDWGYIKKLGVNIKGIEPYLIYWNNEEFESLINTEGRTSKLEKLYLVMKRISVIHWRRALVTRLLKWCGHYVGISN